MKTLFKLVSFFSITFCFLMIVSSSLNAANIPARGPVPFSVYDANNDGYVTEQEFYDVRAQRIQQRVDQGMPMRNVGNSPDFSAFDANGDGKLTELELTKGQNAMMQNRKQNMMGNGNKAKGFGQKGMMQQQ